MIRVVIAGRPVAGAVVVDCIARGFWRRGEFRRCGQLAFRITSSLLVSPCALSALDLVETTWFDAADGGPVTANECVRIVIQRCRFGLFPWLGVVVVTTARGYVMSVAGARAL